MTTETEHLLTILGEECGETAVRCSKAIRFGLSEIQPGQKLTNADRIRQEFIDICAVYTMLVGREDLPPIDFESEEVKSMIKNKQLKVGLFMNMSRELGALE